MSVGTETVIRKATKSDLDSILTIENSSFGWFDRFPESLFLFYLWKFEDGFFVILGSSGSVVGYAIVVDGRRCAYLFSIAVHPNSRNKGYGEMLLKFLESDCRKKRIPKVRLDVKIGNDAAVELYKKLGYVEVKKKKNYYGDGLDALMMEKTVSPLN